MDGRRKEGSRAVGGGRRKEGQKEGGGERVEEELLEEREEGALNKKWRRCIIHHWHIVRSHRVHE